jgi:methyltransferase
VNQTLTVAVLGTGTALLVMLGELLLSRANEQKLRAIGAVEPSHDVYRAMAWAYPASFVAMGLEGALSGRVPGPITVTGAVVFLAAKALKFWAIASLGPRWTFRVLVPPAASFVTTGPYRWLRHPNYVAVIGELVGFAIVVGARATAIVAVAAFGMLLWRRISVEDQALGRSGPA